MKEEMKEKIRNMHPLKIGLFLISYIFLLWNLQDLLGILKQFFSLLTPFLFGFVIAYLLNPVSIFLKSLYFRVFKRDLKHTISLIFSYLLVAIFGFLLCANIFPQINKSIDTLVKDAPIALESGYHWLETEGVDLLKTFTNNDEVVKDIITAINTNIEPFLKNILGNFDKIVSATLSLTTFVFNLVLGFVISIYMLARKDTYKGQAIKIIYAFFEENTGLKIIEFFKKVHHTFTKFIDARIIDSFIIGILCYIGCLIFGFNNAVLIAFIIGVTNVIPYFGPFMGGIPCALIVFMQGPVKMFWFVVFILVLQQFDGNVLGPKLLGDSLGLSSMWVLFSVVLMTGLFGLVGMFIGVPIFAVIYMLIKELVYLKLNKKGKSVRTEDYLRKKE